MRNKKLRWLLAALIGVPVVILALYLLAFTAFFIAGPVAEDYSRRIAFDEKSWRERSLDRADPQWPTRLRMIDDLIAKRRLDGLTRTDLLTLLGPSDQTDKWREWHLVYWLGPNRGAVRIDSEWLVIRFNDSGYVASYRIVTD